MASISDHKSAEAFLEAYLRELLAVGNRSKYTIRNYRGDIGHYLAWLRSREREPLTTTRQEFRLYLGELRDSGGSGVHFSGKGLREHGWLWAELVGDWLEK